MSKVVICGSRTASEQADHLENPLVHEVYMLLSNKYDGIGCTIISGGAKGADTFAKNFAKAYDTAFIEILPDWETHGKKAGYLRNIEMLDQDGVSMVIAIWDGKSKGTKHTIDCASARGINTHILFFEE